jgi:hypothetical protein
MTTAKITGIALVYLRGLMYKRDNTSFIAFQNRSTQHDIVNESRYYRVFNGG